MYRLHKIARFFSTHYALDLRALALLRIGAALLVLADLAIRGSDLEAHYTANGLWPADLIYNFGWKPGFWSLHSLNDTRGWELFLFCCQALAAVLLLIGYKTRLATLLVWLLTISLHNRNLFVLQSGDDLLRLLLLWGLFLPWQACYSIDAWQGKTRAQQNTLANIGYLLLLASVYFFTVSLKRGSEWHSEGSAIYYALSLDQLRLPGVGDWLYQFPALMKTLTWLVFYVEQIIPILILWPSKKGYLRLIAFGFICLLHLGIGLTLYVGLFFAISMVAALGLLPGFVLNKLGAVLRTGPLPAVSRSTPPVFKWVANSCCAMLIVLCLIINLSSVNWFPYQLRPEVSYAANALRLNQYWGMFSPCVLKTDGWLVYHGSDSLGRQWDLRLNQDYVDYHKPAHVVSMYKSDRWRKLAENMQGSGHTFLRPLYCKYILRNWNGRHPEKKLATLNLYFMQKENLPAYKTTPAEKKLFCVCIQ